MVRGTFANIRLRNLLAPGTEGGVTLHLPDKKLTSIFEASEQYQKEACSALMILAGKQHGSGSSRDWAAKGPALLGASSRRWIAESYERIHRSNLIVHGHSATAVSFTAKMGRAWGSLDLKPTVLPGHRPGTAAAAGSSRGITR